MNSLMVFLQAPDLSDMLFIHKMRTQLIKLSVHYTNNCGHL